MDGRKDILKFEAHFYTDEPVRSLKLLLFFNFQLKVWPYVCYFVIVSSYHYCIILALLFISDDINSVIAVSGDDGRIHCIFYSYVERRGAESMFLR